MSQRILGRAKRRPNTTHSTAQPLYISWLPRIGSLLQPGQAATTNYNIRGGLSATCNLPRGVPLLPSVALARVTRYCWCCWRHRARESEREKGNERKSERKSSSRLSPVPRPSSPPYKPHFSPSSPWLQQTAAPPRSSTSDWFLGKTASRVLGRRWGLQVRFFAAGGMLAFSFLFSA